MVCAPGVAGIAAIGAVSAVVAAEVGERDENLARVGDDAGTELLFQRARSGEQFGQKVVIAGQQLDRNFGSERMAVATIVQVRDEIVARAL